MAIETLHILANKDCKACRGWGVIAGESVPYGSGYARQPDEFCDCVSDQIPDYDIVVDVDPEVQARHEAALAAESEMLARQAFDDCEA